MKKEKSVLSGLKASSLMQTLFNDRIHYRHWYVGFIHHHSTYAETPFPRCHEGLGERKKERKALNSQGPARNEQRPRPTLTVFYRVAYKNFLVVPHLQKNFLVAETLQRSKYVKLTKRPKNVLHRMFSDLVQSKMNLS
jgi:hypothetical protein